MGFRRVRDMNLAMLGKQGWKFLSNPEALVTRVFKARYFPKCSFIDAGKGSNPSFVWSSIRESQGLLRKGTRWRIGDGNTVKVWGDPWLPNSQNPFVMTTEMAYFNAPTVSSLLCVDEKRWDTELIRDIFYQRDAQLILNLPLSYAYTPDMMYWEGESNGIYSVRSAYKLEFGNLEQDCQWPWTVVWNFDIPQKIKCFFWTMCKLKLPTKDALLVKQVACNPICPLCGDMAETAVHLFAECSFAHLCWQELETGWPMESARSIPLWIEKIWKALPTNMVEKVVIICWAIWENRNQMVWKAQGMDPRTMVRIALAYVTDWKSAQQGYSTAMVNPTPIQTPSTTWSPPLSDYCKLNIDVAMDFGRSRMGFGWILRDSEGIVKGAAMSMMVGIYSVKEAEAIGAREALSWIKKKGWSHVILETDAEVVTKAVHERQNHTPFGAIMNDIRTLLLLLPYVSFIFAKRDANLPAHFLAKFALCNSVEGVIEFLDSIPFCISPHVSADFSGLIN
ncbi:PREDICTED: uncharacterized protein LOC109148642 [Ipomoea nil]|uniref:uncharacterized protein LOC109148642 n=1 Tax=Ipomoea nil TaxID=35883 RepID=UPI0009011193|nr:PREDICTED: uncharacterized protein LOC109148642 [Ipomoea nil]